MAVMLAAGLMVMLPLTSKDKAAPLAMLVAGFVPGTLAVIVVPSTMLAICVPPTTPVPLIV